MVVTPFTAVGTASTVLALSKAAWKLGSSLSKLNQNAPIVDKTARNLAVEVKSLGNECDLIYAELDEVVSKSETGSPLPYDVDGKIGNCLLTQLEETSRTLQELELFVKSVQKKEPNVIDQAQRQRKLDETQDLFARIQKNVCSHRDELRITLLLINT